mmetsp:Transcript_39549/g.92412  ORF Transcript_39549/g.92412 Transcript_39549/m.92412 type:complete len:108 (-) Transcript_39549:899-1222(-)
MDYIIFPVFLKFKRIDARYSSDQLLKTKLELFETVDFSISEHIHAKSFKKPHSSQVKLNHIPFWSRFDVLLIFRKALTQPFQNFNSNDIIILRYSAYRIYFTFRPDF